jgi:hypothetical protein
LQAIETNRQRRHQKHAGLGRHRGADRTRINVRGRHRDARQPAAALVDDRAAYFGLAGLRGRGNAREGRKDENSTHGKHTPPTQSAHGTPSINTSHLIAHTSARWGSQDYAPHSYQRQDDPL